MNLEVKRMELLKVENLSVGFKTNMGTIVPVKGVNFSLQKGETLGLVGESGCGKSVTAYAITRSVSYTHLRAHET